jgi:hypothetical protein
VYVCMCECERDKKRRGRAEGRQILYLNDNKTGPDRSRPSTIVTKNQQDYCHQKLTEMHGLSERT